MLGRGAQIEKRDTTRGFLLYKIKGKMQDILKIQDKPIISIKSSYFTYLSKRDEFHTDNTGKNQCPSEELKSRQSFT